MKKGVRRIIMAMLIVVFLVSGGMVLKKYMDYRAGEETYSQVEELAGIDIDENIVQEPLEDTDEPQGGQQPSGNEGNEGDEGDEEPEDKDTDEKDNIKEEKKQNPLPKVSVDNLKNLNLEALQKVNKEVMGWIIIPGAGISYPLMNGDDNSYYLNRTWDKQWNTMGSIFLEAECSSKLTDFNTIIYGHNMRNTTMFSNLKKYTSKSYWKKAPYVYLATEKGVYRYDIFAAYEVEVDGHVFWLKIKEAEHKQLFIDRSLEMSEIDTGIVPTTSDKILSLSTCTGNGHAKRMVVQAVFAGEE